MKPNLNLHIERLVLAGVAPADRHRVGEALRLELTRLLHERGVPPALSAGYAVARLDLGTLEPTSTAGPDALGARIAQRIYQGFTP